MTDSERQASAVIPSKILISIGILAWNEEESIGAALRSLFAQSLFPRLEAKNACCEILCVTNGCTDRTPAVAAEICESESARHPNRSAFSARLCDITQRGKNNAWNLFVHQLSQKQAKYLILMDGDIVLQHPDTLWNMYQALQTNDEAVIATDCPIKDVAFKQRKRLRDLASLGASGMTRSTAAQVTGQLYCIRSAAARNIYLPRDLVACEDGFIKSLVCTYFLTRDSTPERVVQAESASHVFQAYTSLGDVLRNQKRQMIGQTIVHILVDKFLKELPLEKKLEMADTIREAEHSDPLWLKRLIGDHLRHIRFFWRLYPRLLSSRFARLSGVPGARKAFYFPIALAAWAIALLTAWRAHRFLRQGYTDYWPDTRSPHLKGPTVFGNGGARDPVFGQATTN